MRCRLMQRSLTPIQVSSSPALISPRLLLMLSPPLDFHSMPPHVAESSRPPFGLERLPIRQLGLHLRQCGRLQNSSEKNTSIDSQSPCHSRKTESLEFNPADLRILVLLRKALSTLRLPLSLPKWGGQKKTRVPKKISRRAGRGKEAGSEEKNSKVRHYPTR